MNEKQQTIKLSSAFFSSWIGANFQSRPSELKGKEEQKRIFGYWNQFRD